MSFSSCRALRGSRFIPTCTPTSRSGLGCVAPSSTPAHEARAGDPGFGALGDLGGNVPSPRGFFLAAVKASVPLDINFTLDETMPNLTRTYSYKMLIIKHFVYCKIYSHRVLTLVHICEILVWKAVGREVLDPLASLGILAAGPHPSMRNIGARCHPRLRKSDAIWEPWSWGNLELGTLRIPLHHPARKEQVLEAQVAQNSRCAKKYRRLEQANEP